MIFLCNTDAAAFYTFTRTRVSKACDAYLHELIVARAR